MNFKAAFMSDRDNWETPQILFDELNARYHFTLDPASDEQNHKCPKYFTKEHNGLLQSWENERVFCNPPYGKEIGLWAQKAFEENRDHGTFIVMLMPARTDTKWFHNYIYGTAELQFLKGRLRFELEGKPKLGAPFPSMLVIYNAPQKRR